jgi:hypothetical protein
LTLAAPSGTGIPSLLFLAPSGAKIGCCCLIGNGCCRNPTNNNQTDLWRTMPICLRK